MSFNICVLIAESTYVAKTPHSYRSCSWDVPYLSWAYPLASHLCQQWMSSFHCVCQLQPWQLLCAECQRLVSCCLPLQVCCSAQPDCQALQYPHLSLLTSPWKCGGTVLVEAKEQPHSIKCILYICPAM